MIVVMTQHLQEFAHAAAPWLIGADELVPQDDAHDMDGDGLPDTDEDWLAHTDPFRPDTDGDRIPDGTEWREGTDPLNPSNFCFSCTVLIQTDDPAHTNGCCAYSVGGNTLLPAIPFTGSAGPFPLPHFTVTNGALPGIITWIDTDGNSGYTPYEPMVGDTVSLTGHAFSVTVDLQRDTDRDGMPDNWETPRGLRVADAADAREDPDGDGLINLHEWFAHADPWVPDGSNTLLYAMTRSIDDRIRGLSPSNALQMFVNYPDCGTNLVRNADFWAADLDFSSVSVWNDHAEHHSRTAVAVSPRHVMMANHWHVAPGTNLYFFGANNVLHVNKIIAVRKVVMAGVDMSKADVMVGLLDHRLPPEVSIAKIFDSNLLDKIKTGKWLPVIQINQYNEALVNEITDMTPDELGECLFALSNEPLRTDFSDWIVEFDSGSPSFALIGDELVLIGLHHKYNSDPGYWYWANAIQAVMNELLPENPYLLQRFDLSDY